MPRGQTANKLLKLFSNPSLLTLNLAVFPPLFLDHWITWPGNMCLHLCQKNKASGIRILVRSNNVKLPSSIALFLLCLSYFRNICFRICCVNAGFNFTMESEKQWHEKMFILLNMYGIHKGLFHFQLISQFVCLGFIYLFIFCVCLFLATSP